MQGNCQGRDGRKCGQDSEPGAKAASEQHLHQDISSESMNDIERVTDVGPKTDQRDRSYDIRKSHRGSKSRHRRDKTQQKRVISQKVEMLHNAKHQHHSEHRETSSRGLEFAAVQKIESDPDEHEKQVWRA